MNKGGDMGMNVIPTESQEHQGFMVEICKGWENAATVITNYVTETITKKGEVY